MAKDVGQNSTELNGAGSQVIQNARGNLIKRNDSRVLARGELFIQTVNLLQENVVATHSEVAPAGLDSSKRKHRIYDLGTKSYINTFFEGDLFAGTGRYGEVWALGSGGALKWGGVVGFDSTTSDPWEALKEKGKTKPNFIFMYVGVRPIAKSTDSDGLKASDKSIDILTDTTTPIKNRDPGTRGEDSVDVESRYVGFNSSESIEIINPGDLFFYSPVYDENVVIHLSHSTDALTKINQFALVSNSMKKYFTDLLGPDPNDARIATLKDFLDGPARRFQSLIGPEGWNAITITEAETNANADEAAHIVGCEEITPENFEDTDFDGAIHYIPFTNGRHRVPFVAGDQVWDNGGAEDNRLHEGDLILSIPSEGGGLTYSVISLYGKLLDILSAKNLDFKRADDYANNIWNNESAVADKYDTDAAFKASLNNVITDYIKRLFLTKVDIDPSTGKIISSQLPDFLLGAPKYMSTINDPSILSAIKTAIEDGDEETEPDQKNAHDLALAWTEAFENIDTNVDTEDTDEGESEANTAYDTKLQAGCYWIWNAGHLVIDNLGDYFNLTDKKDDHDLNGNGEWVHSLENGDWIIYNGKDKKFDILDNSSSFIGILMDGVKIAGTPEFKDVQREITEEDWDGKPVKALNDEAPHEVKLTPTSSSLEFSNPNSVVFKKDGEDGEAFVHDNHIPVISGAGIAKDSRIELTRKHAGLKLPSTKKEDATPALDSIEFLFSKYINEQVATYVANNPAGGTALNEKFFENNDDHHYVLHGFGQKPSTTSISSTVLDFQEFTFSQESDRDDVNGVGKYSFEILGEKAPVLELPIHSGVLATERYVDSGFVVVKKIIEDLYDEIMKQTTSGRIDWLQTLVPAETPTGKKIYDSRVKQILIRGNDEDDPNAVNNLGFGFYLVKKFEDNSEVNDATSIFSKLIIKKTLEASDGPIDVELYEGEGGTIQQTYNPKDLPTGGKVENILPNHSGVLLNNNSVIDGGEWL